VVIDERILSRSTDGERGCKEKRCEVSEKNKQKSREVGRLLLKGAKIIPNEGKRTSKVQKTGNAVKGRTCARVKVPLNRR